MISGTVWILLVLAVVLLLGLYLRNVLMSRRVYWRSRRIPFVAWPHLLFGNVRGLWSSEHSSTLLQRIYRDLKERRLAAGGFNLFVSPSILVIDPDLVQQILEKGAEVFRDRGLYVDSAMDPLSDTLFGLGGKQWQEKRVRLAPVFSEQTIRRVFGTIASVANELQVEIRKNYDRSEIDVQEWVYRYVTHVLGTSVFGVRCRTIQYSNTEFRATGEKAGEFSWITLLKHWAGVALPSIARKMGLRITDASVEKFYAGLCTATVLHRKSYGVWKDDILQLLIRLREEQKISMDELTTQCYSFVKYGLETCTSVMTFCLYELAKNDTIQNRLREGINHSLEDTDGQLTYEVIMSMPYLDQVVNETMRKYPPMDLLYRRSNTTHSKIPKGTLFVIPVYALHHDPDHFPSPEKFDPDRFASGVKTRHPYCYLPFGAGPRGCVGAHFGSLVVKIGLVTLLRNFRFVLPADDNNDDDGGFQPGEVKFKPNALVLSPIEGSLRLGVERI
ncbi:probable cytochrome P450 6a13 [Ochlerotatus camptorhynchus]|uniref:probable cytochrome P450 6a13 n=1 Tax=Ochlerotatus camptorhynchus TaxID=644619 RepID=UPI0031D0E1C0